jgi:pimeloyl-ACP methyl ester carboxylesterase
MGEDTGGTIPEALARSVAVPTLVLAGGSSPDFFRDTAERLAELVPDAELVVLEGHDHGAAPEVVAPVVTKFVTG